MPIQQTGQHTIAWDGIALRTPDDWNIASIGTEERGGYLRIDGPEMPRVELNWTDAAAPADLNSVIGKYLENTRKVRRRKLGEEITVAAGDTALSRRKLRKPGVETFSWEGSQRAYGAAWNCKKCGRRLFIQVLGDEKEEGLPELAEAVIASTTDHSEDENWTLWAVYGFEAWLPTGFRPAGQRLVAGQVELDFKKQTETATVSRWGLANVALRSKSLEDWAKKELWKQLKAMAPRAETEQIHGHEGLRIRGERVVFHEVIRRFVSHVRGQLFADRAVVLVWHCPQENKIFVVRTFVDMQNAGLADEIAARIRCHEGSGAC